MHQSSSLFNLHPPKLLPPSPLQPQFVQYLEKRYPFQFIKTPQIAISTKMPTPSAR